MLDNSALKEPFDVSSLTDEVAALVAGRGPEAFAPPERGRIHRRDRRLLEPRIEDNTEMAESTGTTDAAPASGSVEAILTVRAKTHGDFTDNARVAQDLKRIMHSQVGWDKLTDVQREALHMILHKIARIIAGNPNVKDHWDDIAGYAKLASERIVE
jgi:hypothetical protein